jgi:hypothetical protein
VKYKWTQFLMEFWWKPELSVGSRSVMNNGLWPSALVLVGIAALVVSQKCLDVTPPPK